MQLISNLERNQAWLFVINAVFECARLELKWTKVKRSGSKLIHDKCARRIGYGTKPPQIQNFGKPQDSDLDKLPTLS